MLTNLHVKNLALIEESEVSLEPGLNILTGETGAGKSIIIGSINYALGAKIDHDVIREGADYALVELVFQIDNEDLIQKVKEMDLPVEEDGTIIITRKIMPGRSSMKICGENVTVKQVKELAALLIDIHGQHEHQSLLQPAKQREMLDRFAGEELGNLKIELARDVKAFRELETELEHLSMDEGAREREISLTRYEVNEIEEASLIVGEDIELEVKYKKMQNAQKIIQCMQIATQCIGESDESVLNQLGTGLYELQQAAAMDEQLVGVKEQLADAESIIGDAFHQMQRYMDDFAFGEEEFDEVQKRLDVINHLTMKYGGSIEKVLAYGEKRRSELEKLEDLGGYLEELRNKADNLEKKILAKCEKIHKIRTKLAKELSKEISAVLEDLNFLKVSFEIAVEAGESFTSDGYDIVNFMISLNPGEKMRAVSDVASGGELSRIMLALKTVFAGKDEIGTLIFDEIDTGISGKTAWKVSERMATIARNHQVICITHLPQIASMADTHFMIAKKEMSGKTVTDIYPLEESQMLEEVARLLGTDDITETVLNNAKELRQRAQETKKKSK